jgi:hypothetical protein
MEKPTRTSIVSYQFRPIVDKDGQVVLHDIYVSHGRGPQQWIGSRRTKEQCQDAVDAYLRQHRAQAENAAPA